MQDKRAMCAISPLARLAFCLSLPACEHEGKAQEAKIVKSTTIYLVPKDQHRTSGQQGKNPPMLYKK